MRREVVGVHRVVPCRGTLRTTCHCVIWKLETQADTLADIYWTACELLKCYRHKNRTWGSCVNTAERGKNPVRKRNHRFKVLQLRVLWESQFNRAINPDNLLKQFYCYLKRWNSLNGALSMVLIVTSASSHDSTVKQTRQACRAFSRIYCHELLHYSSSYEAMHFHWVRR